MKKILFALITLILFTACVDEEKIKKDAFRDGYEKGQKVKYTTLVKKYYSDQSILKLNNLKYNSQFKPREEIKNLKSNSKADFQKVVYDMNKDILDGISFKLNLSNEQRHKILNIYNSSHRNISSAYYKQYLDLCNKKELNRTPGDFINYTYCDRTEALTEVVSSQLCSTLGFIIGTLNLDEPSNKIAGILAGTPCTVISTQLLKPITTDLLECGFIEDITTSKTIIESKISNMIIELASVEKHYNTTISITNEVKTFWGLGRSTANASANYYGIIKAGYNLGNKFQINIDYPNHKILIITDKPKIFDPIIYPQINKIDNGWVAKIDEATLNNMQVKATNQILNLAKQDNILYEAERNAQTFLYNILEPIAKIPPKPFKVEIVSVDDYKNMNITELKN